MKRSLVLAALFFMAASCTSIKDNNGSLGALDGALGKAQPYTEAYLEYPGPAVRWAGPPSVLIHVVARDQGKVQVTITPPLWGKVEPIELKPVAQRIPSSASGSEKRGMDAQAAREWMATLSVAMQENDAVYSGCLYPVRARLIHQDGAVTEKSGCRGHGKWVAQLSQIASDVIDSTQ